MKPRFTLTEWFTREWFPFFLFFVGILTTFGFALYIDQVADNKEQTQLENYVQNTESMLNSEFSTSVAFLHAGVGLYQVNKSLTLPQFRAFIQELDLANSSPGQQNIGFIEVFSENERPQYEQFMRNQYGGNFKIFPDAKTGQYEVVNYVEPASTASPAAAIGFNMASDQIRAQAMKQAAETTITPATVAERQQHLTGFLYSPFRASDFFHNTLGSQIESPGVFFSIYDGDSTDEKNLIFQSNPQLANGPQSVTNTSQNRTFVVEGRTWTIRFFTTPAFRNSIERQLVSLTILSGLTVSLLLFILSRSQQRARLEAENRSHALRLSEKELKQSRGQYQLVVEHTNDLINLFSPDGRFLYVSPSYESVLGYKPKLLVEKNLLDFVHPDDKEKIEFEMANAKQGKVGHSTFRFQHKHGTYITLDSVANGITDDNNIVYVIVATARDVSEQIELERRKDEFMSIASHELKTPVTSLKAYAQYLGSRFKKSGDHQSSQLMDKMDKQLDKLTSLITDLLDTTKVEAGKLAMHKELFDLNVLTAEIIEQLQRITDTHSITLESSIPKKVFGDSERIGQVITNLIANAITYSPNGKTVVVKLSASKTSAIVSVHDDGIGVSKEKQKKIFQRWFRVENKGQETFPGLGLGLYISSQIIRRHQGKIWVESETNQGSSFIFKLPFYPSPDTVKTPKSKK